MNETSWRAHEAAADVQCKHRPGWPVNISASNKDMAIFIVATSNEEQAGGVITFEALLQLP